MNVLMMFVALKMHVLGFCFEGCFELVKWIRRYWLFFVVGIWTKPKETFQYQKFIDIDP